MVTCGRITLLTKFNDGQPSLEIHGGMNIRSEEEEYGMEEWKMNIENSRSTDVYIIRMKKKEEKESKEWRWEDEKKETKWCVEGRVQKKIQRNLKYIDS